MLRKKAGIAPPIGGGCPLRDLRAYFQQTIVAFFPVYLY
jgi:hypothetical protein